MSEDVEFTTHSVPINRALYDEFAREHGYRDLADLEAQAEAERAKLTPEQRELADEMDRRVEHMMLFGEGVSGG